MHAPGWVTPPPPPARSTSGARSSGCRLHPSFGAWKERYYVQTARCIGHFIVSTTAATCRLACSCPRGPKKADRHRSCVMPVVPRAAGKLTAAAIQYSGPDQKNSQFDKDGNANQRRQARRPLCCGRQPPRPRRTGCQSLLAPGAPQMEPGAPNGYGTDTPKTCASLVTRSARCRYFHNPTTTSLSCF